MSPRQSSDQAAIHGFIADLTESASLIRRTEEAILQRGGAAVTERDCKDLIQLWIRGKRALNSAVTISAEAETFGFHAKLERIELLIKACGVDLRHLEAASSKMKTTEESSGVPNCSNEDKSVEYWRDLLRTWCWQLLIIVMLLSAILYDDHDYSYFMVLRFACCAAFGLWAWKAHKLMQPLRRNAFGLAAAAYNPFLPLSLDEDWWRGVNFAACVLATASAIEPRNAYRAIIRIPQTLWKKRATIGILALVSIVPAVLVLAFWQDSQNEKVRKRASLLAIEKAKRDAALGQVHSPIPMSDDEIDPINYSDLPQIPAELSPLEERQAEDGLYQRHMREKEDTH